MAARKTTRKGTRKTTAVRKRTSSAKAKRPAKRPVAGYTHAGARRANNPPAGLVNTHTDPDTGQQLQRYAYDPHLSPQLQWAGKAERAEFQVPLVSLHRHERIDPRTIISAVKRRNGANGAQSSLFEAEREIPLREALDFYRHELNWSNRLIAGDSLLVMNSLLHKENLAGRVQCVYMDPPYGIKYGSNFQPFVNKNVVKEDKDENLTSEPETIRAFRDTWELGIHSFLSYMRDRLLLAKELLTESGSCFVQISDENLHHVREIMSEIFGEENFINIIPFRKKTAPQECIGVTEMFDYLLWYAKDKRSVKIRNLFIDRDLRKPGSKYLYRDVDGQRETIKNSDFGDPSDWNKIYRLGAAVNRRNNRPQFQYELTVNGKKLFPPQGYGWIEKQQGMKKLLEAGRAYGTGMHWMFKIYYSDFPYEMMTNVWTDVSAAQSPDYVVQTDVRVPERCMLMTTDPGDLVFDPTCGSGTTAFVAEQWGRRWITCDTSRVALTLARQRLMTATFDWYQLAQPERGINSGFHYKEVPHITLKSIANNVAPDTEKLYDQPLHDTKRARITGPFTVEAVPAPAVKPLSEADEPEAPQADASVARSGETLRQSEWRDELLRSGIRGKRGQRISFARLETRAGTRWLHAEGETRPGDELHNETTAATDYEAVPVAVSFGPQHAPLEKRQVENAWQEARTIIPRPKLLVFAAFQFDPEAAKDIDETSPQKTGMQFLKAQMNPDLQTADLKKKRAGNESYWLIGQPDVAVRRIERGPDTGKYEVEVRGFDYFNTRNGELQSGGTGQIAVWMLDSDYDRRCLYPRQVFFPMAGAGEGWARLARNLKAEVDEDLMESYRGAISLPFALGKHSRIAVKIVDDRGIESLKVVEIVEPPE